MYTHTRAHAHVFPATLILRSFVSAAIVGLYIVYTHIVLVQTVSLDAGGPYIVQEGEPLNLVCSGEAHTLNRAMEWLKVSSTGLWEIILFAEKKDDRSHHTISDIIKNRAVFWRQDKNSILQLSRTRFNDTGMYTCRAKTFPTPVRSEPASVTIIGNTFYFILLYIFNSVS